LKNPKGIMRTILVLFVVLIAYTLYNQEVMINKIEKNIATQQMELENVMKENEKLSNLVDSMNSEDYTIRSARSRLGLLRPGEIPVIDSSNHKEP
jgi:cell division protein FtsB